jgi:hypothetical protein
MPPRRRRSLPIRWNLRSLPPRRRPNDPDGRGMIGGWHWSGRSGLAADWRILPPSPDGEATLHKIAAHCDDRRMTTRRFPPQWRADKMPGGYVVRRTSIREDQGRGAASKRSASIYTSADNKVG